MRLSVAVADTRKCASACRYEGTYAKRGGDKADGCATLWRKDAFKMLAIETIHFSEHALRDNVALIVVLEARQQPAASANSSEASKQRRLILGNVHILFNPKRGKMLVTDNATACATRRVTASLSVPGRIPNCIG